MYCPVCGKENSQNAKFCIYCGNEFVTNTNTQTQPQAISTSKPKRKPWIGIIIGLAAFLVSTAIVAPIVANSYSNNSSPSANLNAPKIESNNDFVSGEHVITKEYFSEVHDTISSTIILLARGDEVMTISGNFFLSDLTLSEFDDVKYNFETMQEFVENNNIDNILINISETQYSYSITFSFTNLNYESGELAAKTAAELLGFSFTSGHIKLSEAENTLLTNGYILKAEY